ncbi:MAG: hypothetical protein SFY66_09430 [Oculatellaceae cyanobacterium bins.114]|nr:hypothetical protein [Oculatellaceae cyanobacterium bins.114]
MTEDKATQKSAGEPSEELSDEQLKGVAGGAGRPPSGDLNPSDLTNPTVDTSEVINPHAQ